MKWFKNFFNKKDDDNNEPSYVIMESLYGDKIPVLFEYWEAIDAFWEELDSSYTFYAVVFDNNGEAKPLLYVDSSESKKPYIFPVFHTKQEARNFGIECKRTLKGKIPESKIKKISIIPSNINDLNNLFKNNLVEYNLGSQSIMALLWPVQLNIDKSGQEVEEMYIMDVVNKVFVD